MPDSTNPLLDSVVSIANASIRPKILTPDNFEVLSVQPFKESTSTHNTLVTVKIDLGAASPLIALSESDRYAKRSVKLTRIDLADVVKFREIEKNSAGQYQIEASTVADVIDALGIGALPEELEEIVVDEEAGVSIIRAVPDSLGWKGQFTITRDAGTDETEWSCTGNVTRIAAVADSGMNTPNREYDIRIKVGSDAPRLFTIAGTANLAGLISNSGSFVAFLIANDIAFNQDSAGLTEYFTNNSQVNGVQFEIIPKNEASVGKLTAEAEQENTSFVTTEEDALRFCLAPLPPNVAGLIITNTNLPTTNGDGEVQLTYDTVPNPAYTGGIETWTVTAGAEYASVSETGLLTIIGAPEGILIGVRLTSLNDVSVTKNLAIVYSGAV